MKAAFICVNYNNSQVSVKYILNVLEIKQNYDIKIIIVDNASEENDINELDKFILDLKSSDVVFIKSTINLGYFKGLNLGIDWALQNGFNQYQIIGNNDLQFFPDFLKNLENIVVKVNELVLAPDVITTLGIHENPHVIHKMSFLRKLKYDIYFFNYYLARFITLFYSTDRKPKAFYPQKKYIHMGIGALYVLTPYFFKFFNKLWDDVFLYGEEAVLAGQILSVDGKIVYEPSLKCNHIESLTTSRMKSRFKYEVIQKSYRVYKKYL
jgi:GT2 family glycosyltransferase